MPDGNGRTVLRGGRVVDGLGGPPVVKDILIEGDTIAAVGRFDRVDGAELDLRGTFVTPGFIDAHVHVEGSLLTHGVIASAAAQGVTTFIIGQDGCGWAPGHGRAFAYMRDYFAAVNGDYGGLPPGGLTVDALLALYDGRVAQNVAYLVPHGLLRVQVAGPGDAPLDLSALGRMRDVLERAMGEGAIGLSTGFDYVPSRFAGHDELVELCGVLRNGGVYVSHTQGYGARVRIGLSALRRVGADAGIPVHASHLWGDAEGIEAELEAGEEAGVSITFDMYPYDAGSSLLAMVMLPPGLQGVQSDTLIERLADPAVRRGLIDAEPRAPLDQVVIAHVDSPEHRHLEGLSLAAAADETGTEALSLVCDLLIAARLRVGVVRHGRAIDEAQLEWLVERPEFMGGSDGIYLGSHPHPRGAGSFTRTLLGYLRRHGTEAGWTRAVHHLSTAAAERFRLPGRGRLAPGFAADIAVFDPDRLEERATYANPTAHADGLLHLFVNGVRVASDGAVKAGRSGRALKLGEM